MVGSGAVKSVIRRLIQPLAGLAVLIFAALYVTANSEKFGEALGASNPGQFVAAVFLCAFYWLGLAASWWLLQRQMGGGLRLFPAMRAWSVSTVARYVPGNVWHLVGRSAMAAQYGGDPIVAAASSVYEQLLTVAGALLLAGLLLPLSGAAIYLLAALAVPMTLAILHPAVQRFLLRLAARYTKRPLPDVLPASELGLILVVYAVAQVPAGLGLCLLALPGDLTLSSGIGGFAFAWAVGFLSLLTPSGIGVREVALTAVLSPLGHFADIGLLAVAHRAAMTIAEFSVAGVFAVAGKGIRGHKRPAEGAR